MSMKDKAWPEVNPACKKVVIPLGSFEQHGPHLPLRTDSLIAESVAEKVAERLGCEVSPPIPFGVSPEHMDFPGTITLSEKTLLGVIGDVSSSLRAHGFKKQYLINAHGGNSEALERLSISGLKAVDLIKFQDFYDHAGDFETSIIMFLSPKDVRKGKIRKQEYTLPGKKKWRTIEHSGSGVLGEPHDASAKKGKKYFEMLVSKAVEEIRNG